MKYISHSKPTIGEREFLLVKKVLSSGQLTQDKFVEEFELLISKLFEKKYSVSVSSGTNALYLLLLSLGVGEKDEVIIPAFSCSALLYAVLYTGAKPVIADVEYQDMNISYEDICCKITKKTKVIIVPHMFGFPSKNIREIVSLGIPVIEDCAQSIGAKVFGKQVGSFSDYVMTSFYGTKMLTSGGEGGAVITNSKKVFSYVKDMRDYDKKFFNRVKYNYKITELQAAVGIAQVKNLEKFILARKKISQIYTTELKNCSNIEVPYFEKEVEPVFYRYIIKFNNKLKLKKVVQRFKEVGIEVARPIFMPLDKFYYGRYECFNSKKYSLKIPF